MNLEQFVKQIQDYGWVLRTKMWELCDWKDKDLSLRYYRFTLSILRDSDGRKISHYENVAISMWYTADSARLLALIEMRAAAALLAEVMG